MAMDEHVDPEVADGPLADPPVDVTVRTGNERVDAVLDSLDALDDLPVDEHVAVFERAHEELRGALDARPDS
jgi:hypothetical protein